MRMKSGYGARSIATIAIWLFTAVIALADTLFIVVDILDLVVMGLVLLSATASTIFIWWFPGRLSETVGSGDQAGAIPLESPGGIWWKLAFVSGAVLAAAIPLWAACHLHGFPASVPIPFIQPLLAVSMIPLIYLHVFVLWHWRIRYAGKRHIAWPILFVCTAWPLFLSVMPASVFVVLTYCGLHLVPDARQSGIYADSVTLTLSSPASPLPKKYQVMKTAFFVVGWVLIVGGVGAAITACTADFLVWGAFEEALQYEVGNQFTESTSKALWGAAQLAKTTSVTCLLATFSSVGGAVCIQISQRLRWRLLEERDTMELERA